MNTSNKTREERLQAIRDGGHGGDYNIVCKMIIDAMKPVSLNHFSKEHREFRKDLHERMQTRKGDDVFGLGTIQTHPVIIREGVMGVVARFKIRGESFVFKTMYGPDSRYGLEETAIAYRHWSTTGVLVPTIIQSRCIDFRGLAVPYHIYNFLETTHKTAFTPEAIGHIVGLLHTVTGKGYGMNIREVDGKIIGDAEYEPLSPRMYSTYKYLDDHCYISTQSAKEIGKAAIKVINASFSHEVPVLGHGDITKGNFIYGDTLAVIDPTPKLGSYCEDLAEYYLRNCIENNSQPELFMQHPGYTLFLKSYLQSSGRESIDQNLLGATLCMQILRKLHIRNMLQTEYDSFSTLVTLLKTLASTYLGITASA